MKNVIITGASGFLGTATVKHFLSKGYKVFAFVHGKRPPTAAEPNLEHYDVDLSDAGKTAAAIAEIIGAHGDIHGCLQLAGGYAGGKPENTTIEMIRQQLSMNFETAYNVAQPVYAHMKQKKAGRIVFIGSQPALIPKKGTWSLPYALSKSLLFQLADILNEDAKGSNVSVSVVVPSTIDTAANRESMPDADFSKWVKPEQIAETMELLCSGAADAWREPVIKVYNNSF